MPGEERRGLAAYVTPPYRQGILLMDGNRILAYLNASKRVASGLYATPREVLKVLLLALPWVSEEDAERAAASLNAAAELEVVRAMAMADLPLYEKEDSIKAYLRERLREVRAK